jgi:hypothetical protein
MPNALLNPPVLNPWQPGQPIGFDGRGLLCQDSQTSPRARRMLIEGSGTLEVQTVEENMPKKFGANGGLSRRTIHRILSRGELPSLQIAAAA